MGGGLFLGEIVSDAYTWTIAKTSAINILFAKSS
jgi:hypothetical protein